MRIDDENKVVWCNSNLFPLLEEEDFFEMDEFDKITYLLTISFDKRYGIPLRVETDIWKSIIISIFEEYCFELEQPQKYYWRKKKGHLAWFEEEVYLTSFKFSDNENYCYVLGSKNGSLKRTETEARDLLKDDFDKFEKVECE